MIVINEPCKYGDDYYNICKLTADKCIGHQICKNYSSMINDAEKYFERHIDPLKSLKNSENKEDE
jgi:hypothetical protein